MLEDLRPMSVNAVAKHLGLDPFETVRLLVALDVVPDGIFVLQPEVVATLRKLGRIDPSWWADAPPTPEGLDPGLHRVRLALGKLLERDHVEDMSTRIDNVWRGLPLDEQALLQRALTALAEEGLLRIAASPIGTMVAVVGAAVPRVRGIADGTEVPATLADAIEARGGDGSTSS